MNMLKYAGIGSRETPQDVFNWMKSFGEWAAQNNLMLRSGGAKGADTAFEIGCNNSMGKKRIFRAENALKKKDWFELAAEFHPNWEACSDYAKRLHARNGAILLGEDLKQPVDFVVCWTKDGKASGGTGQALRIAASKGIPIFNVFNPGDFAALQVHLRMRGISHA